MHRKICAVFAVGLLATLVAPALALSAEDSDLLKSREAVWRAWFASDQKTLEELVPGDSIAINSSDNDWQDQAEILRSAAEFRAEGGKLVRLEFPRTEIRHYGDVAILYSHYLFETDVAGKHSVTAGLATEVFVLRNGRWTNPGWQTGARKPVKPE